MKQKLHDAGIDADFDKEQTASVARLGGRASDLESVSGCVLTSMTPLTAVI